MHQALGVQDEQTSGAMAVWQKLTSHQVELDALRAGVH